MAGKISEATRRTLLITAAVACLGLAALTHAKAIEAIAPLPGPSGPGSASGAPHLPAGFRDTFVSRYVDAGGLRLHAVIGGKGPPLLLVHGWPQTWYQWRLVMPALARDFTVIAVDQRGIGLSDKPQSGYDAGTQAKDMVALMEALGHQRFAMVGFDTGMPIGYALAADHPDRLERLVVGEAPSSRACPLAAPDRSRAAQQAALAHRLQSARRRRERSARPRTRGHLFRRGVRRFGRNAAARRRRPVLRRRLASSPDALRGSFGSYRAIDTDIAQNQQRKTRRLTLPVLAIGGEKGHRRRCREDDEARRGQRADRRHPRQRPLGRRGGSREAARGADPVPGPVPRRFGHGEVNVR